MLLLIPQHYINSCCPVILSVQILLVMASIFQKHLFPSVPVQNWNVGIIGDGIPCCPHDASLPMKPEGTSRLRSGVIRYKFSKMGEKP